MLVVRADIHIKLLCSFIINFQFNRFKMNFTFLNCFEIDWRALNESEPRCLSGLSSSCECLLSVVHWAVLCQLCSKKSNWRVCRCLSEITEVSPNPCLLKRIDFTDISQTQNSTPHPDFMASTFVRIRSGKVQDFCQQHRNGGDKHDNKRHVGKQNYFTWRFVCFDLHLQKWSFRIQVTTW